MISLIRLVFTFWTATAALPTAEMLFLHKEYQVPAAKIADLLGYRLGKMPETIELYRSAAVYRLLHEFVDSCNKECFAVCPWDKQQPGPTIRTVCFTASKCYTCPILWFGLRIYPKKEVFSMRENNSGF